MFDNLSHPLQRAFLAAYARVGRVTEAAQACGISREAHYDWKRDPEYAAAFAQATAMAGDNLEDEATRRAVEGVEDLVLYKGEPVIIEGKPLTRRKYSDKLLDKLLTGAKPEKYSTKHVEHAHEHKHTHELDLSTLDEDELDALDRILGKARANSDAGSDSRGADTPQAEQDRDDVPGDGDSEA